MEIGVKYIWIKKIIHDGSVVALVDSEPGNVLLNVNFGKKENVSLNIRKSNHYILATPSHTIIENSSYTPLIFTKDEFLKLVDISYINKKLIHISQATNEDLIKLWYSTSEQKILLNYDLRNIIVYSDYDEEKNEILLSIKRNLILEIIRFNCKYEDIIAYLEINNKIYEWDAFVRYDTKYA